MKRQKRIVDILNFKQTQFTMRFDIIVFCLITWTVNHVQAYATNNMANTQQYGDPAPGRSPGPPFMHADTKSNQLDDLESPTMILTVDDNDVPEEELISSEKSVENHENHVINLNDCDISQHDDIVRIEQYNTDLNFTLTHRLFRTDMEQVVEGVTYQEDEIVEEDDDTRIIGGERAASAQLPYIVNMRFSSKNAKGEEVTSKFCGGAIIADHWVLTAAHCIVGDKSQGKSLYILGGAVDSQPLMDAHGMEFKVKQTFIHPKYVHGGTPPHDIGLLYIKIKLPSNKFMQKVSLPKDGDMPAKDTEGTIGGWGATNADVGGSQSRYLLTVNAPVLSYEECKKSYVTTLMDKHICFGGKGKSACGGDSGGPLVQIINGEPVLIGVSSYTQRPCGQKPSVYVRVSAYINEFIIPTIQSIEPDAFKN